MNELQTRQSNLALMTSPEDCYTYHVVTFTNWMHDKGYTDPIQSVQEYFTDLNNSSYSAGTIRMKRQAVKNRLRLLADTAQLTLEQNYQFERVMKQLDRNPDTKAPKLNTSAVRGSKVLTETEYYKVLENARSVRQRLFIRFLWQTGCRVTEMTGAELRNCKQVGNTFDVRVLGKGRKERIVKITADLYTAILTEFNGTVYLFETSGGKSYRRSYVSNQIAKLTRDIIGRSLSAHCLRHSFATRQIAKTHKISAVSKYMGHSSVSTTLAMYNHEELTDLELFGEAV